MDFKNIAFQLIFFMCFLSFCSLGETIKNNLKGEQISTSRGEYVIKQPVKITLQKAQKILNTYDQLYRFMPGIYSSTVKSTGKNYKIIDQVYKANYTFGLAIHAEVLMRKISQNEVQYQLLKSDRIRALSGKILLKKIDDQHVLVIHKINIKPAVPFFLKSVFFSRFKAKLAASRIKISEFFA